MNKTFHTELKYYPQLSAMCLMLISPPHFNLWFPYPPQSTRQRHSLGDIAEKEATVRFDRFKQPLLSEFRR